MTADQIIAGMAAAYAGCHSYRDTGRVQTRFSAHNELPGFDSDRPFRTAFTRPHRFRFEFSSACPGSTEWHRYIVHSDKGLVQTWWDVRPGVKREPSLGLALAGATGVSGGSAHTVPALLIPKEVGGQRLTALGELTRLSDEDAGGVRCYCIQGRFPAPTGPQADAARRLFRTMTGMDPPDVFDPMVLWIDRETLLLRRIEKSAAPFGDGAQEVTTYEPAIDDQISDDELAFDVPAV
jgi:hypothetical protein